jgi:translation initiation factor IF-1
MSMSDATMKPGDKVTVNLGRRGGVQKGTVVRVFDDGHFEWKNANNYVRLARASDLTEAPERAGVLDPYVKAWVAEGDDE